MEATRTTLAPPGAMTVCVGGVSFVTTVATLTSGANATGYLARALAHDGGPVIHVDRDPELFKHVLAWLRTASLGAAVEKNDDLLKDLQREAVFFELDEMRDAIDEARLQLREHRVRPFSLTVGHLIEEQAEDVDGSLSEVAHALEVKEGEAVYVTRAICGSHISWAIPRTIHTLECRFYQLESYLEDTGCRADSWMRVPATTQQRSSMLLATQVYHNVYSGRPLEEHDPEDAALEPPASMSHPVEAVLSLDAHCPGTWRGYDGDNYKPNETEAKRWEALRDDDEKRTHLRFYTTLRSGVKWTVYGFVGPEDLIVRLAAGRAPASGA